MGDKENIKVQVSGIRANVCVSWDRCQGGGDFY